MTTKEERLNKTRGRLETWYGCPIDEQEFRVIYAHHQKSKYLLFILWVYIVGAGTLFFNEKQNDNDPMPVPKYSH